MRDATIVDGEASTETTGADRPAALLDLRKQLERLWSRHAALNVVLDEQTAIDSVGRLLLGIVAGNEPIRSSDLAESVGLSRPAVSRRVAGLEAQGLIRSETDPCDRRASLLRLSEQGVAHLQNTVDSGVAVVGHLTDDFALDEVVALGRLLLRLNDNADRLHAATKGTTVEH